MNRLTTNLIVFPETCLDHSKKTLLVSGDQVPEYTGTDKGLTALHELLKIDGDIKQLSLQGDFSAPQIQEIARSKDMRTLREDGMTKAAMGITTFEEVILKTLDD